MRCRVCLQSADGDPERVEGALDGVFNSLKELINRVGQAGRSGATAQQGVAAPAEPCPRPPTLVETAAVRELV
jgi:hypothetical protein